MPAFKDFTEFAEEPLQLPYQGRVFTIPKPTIERGLRLQRVFEGDKDAAAGLDSQGFYRLVLGDESWIEMTEAGVTLDFLKRAVATQIADASLGREFAERTWENGAAAPKAPTPSPDLSSEG